MSGSIILRCGAFPEIDVHDFREWIADTYFKLPLKVGLYKGRFDVDVEIEVDEIYGRIIISADVVDALDLGLESEDLKRELREISRGSVGGCKR